MNVERSTSNIRLSTRNIQLGTFNSQHSTYNFQLSSVNVVNEEASKYDLEERLLDYAANAIRLVEKLPDTRAANHIHGQLLRSGTSPLPNHGEAQAAESADDFIHKMKICLKELRESHRWLRLIQRLELIKPSEQAALLLKETDELIKIFFTSIRTAQKKQAKD